MITGTVRDLRILVDVTFQLPNQPDMVIECVVDTGFEGALALPLDVVNTLGLAFYQALSLHFLSSPSLKT